MTRILLNHGATTCAPMASGLICRCPFSLIPARRTTPSSGGCPTITPGNGRWITTWTLTSASATFRKTSRCRYLSWSCHPYMPDDRLLRPKCVLMTTDTIGGVWTYALELSRGLAQHSLAVVLATMGRPLTQAQRQEAGRVSNLQIEESKYKLEWMYQPWSDVNRAGDWFLKLEERYRPDLAHLNPYSFGVLTWRAPTLVVGHSCVLSWWQAVKGAPAPPEWTRYRQEVCRGLKMAGKVVAPSTAMLR